MGSVIEVRLAESWEKVTGRTWPKRKDGAPLRVTAIEECELSVRVPSQERFNLGVVQSASIVLDGTVVDNVSALPLPTLLPFVSAIKETRKRLTASGIKAPRVMEALTAWGKLGGSTAPTSRMSTGQAVGSGVTVHLELRPHPTGKGWYAVLELAQERKTNPRK
jgi:hypothetical protein